MTPKIPVSANCRKKNLDYNLCCYEQAMRLGVS